MPLLRSVQQKIDDKEGFQVRFTNRLTGRDINDNLKGVPQYHFHRMAKNTWTVGGWKRLRFRNFYPGFEVEVLYGDGGVAPGQTRLATVRDSYSEEE